MSRSPSLFLKTLKYSSMSVDFYTELDRNATCLRLTIFTDDCRLMTESLITARELTLSKSSRVHLIKVAVDKWSIDLENAGWRVTDEMHYDMLKALARRMCNQSFTKNTEEKTAAEDELDQYLGCSAKEFIKLYLTDW